MDCIIADEDFVRGSVRIQSIAEELASVLQEASKVVQDVTNAEIYDQSFSKELEIIYEKMNLFSEMVKEVATDLIKNTTTFLTDIEQADSYLYERKD